MEQRNGEQRKFKGIWIEADLWLDRSVSILEKVMLAEIDSLETPDRGCYASNRRFADFFGLSTKRVSEVINSLVRRGRLHVQIIRSGGEVVERRLWLVNASQKPPVEVSGKSGGGIPKNVEGVSRESGGGYPDGSGEGIPRNVQEREAVERSSRDNSGERGESAGAALPPDDGKKKARAKKTAIADDFGISVRVRRWAAEHGHAQLEKHHAAFVLKCKAKGYTYADWDAAFMGAIRDDWANLGKGSRQGGQQRLTGKAAAVRAGGLAIWGDDDEPEQARRIGGNDGGFSGDCIDV